MISITKCLSFLLGFTVFSTLAIEIAQIDRLTEQWLNIEKQSVQLQRDWQIQQPILEQQLSLLTAEKQQLTALLSTDNTSQQQVETKRSALLNEQTELEQQQADFSKNIVQLNKQLVFIEHFLPPPLKQAWQKEHQALDTEPDLSLQLQVALAKLTKLSAFEQSISVHEMPLNSPQGTEILVKQLYLGLGIAWFTSANGQYSGWGQATDESWQWHFDDQVDAKPIQRAIAIFEKKQQADFVTLPIALAQKTSALSVLPPSAKNGGSAL